MHDEPRHPCGHLVQRGVGGGVLPCAPCHKQGLLAELVCSTIAGPKGLPADPEVVMHERRGLAPGLVWVRFQTPLKRD